MPPCEGGSRWFESSHDYDRDKGRLRSTPFSVCTATNLYHATFARYLLRHRIDVYPVEDA